MKSVLTVVVNVFSNQLVRSKAKIAFTKAKHNDYAAAKSFAEYTIGRN